MANLGGYIYIMMMMSIVRRRSGVSQCDQHPPAFKGGLPTDKGWRKGSRTDSRLLAQAANKTVDAQVDAGRSQVGGGAADRQRLAQRQPN